MNTFKIVIFMLLGLIIVSNVYAEDYLPIKHKAKTNDYVVIFYHADWCSPCQTMKKTVFKDSKVKELLKSFKERYFWVKIDDPKMKKIMEKAKITNIPCFVKYIVNKEGKLVEVERLTGGQSTEKVKKFLQFSKKAVE